MIPFSVLDLSPIVAGGNAAQSLRNTLDLARHAESWDFHRYWLAEHHGMPGIASAATSVVICHVAGGTSRIRVGAGGVMLPNHAPLVIAEQFGTLEALFPGRIDLGLGRAPGSDQADRPRACAATLSSDPDRFPEDVIELMRYLGAPAIQANRSSPFPGAGSAVPLWILGSSLFGAQVAAALGLPFAFASHFAPAMMMPALDIYRARFRPSAQLAQPYVMLGFNIFAAESDQRGQIALHLHATGFRQPAQRPSDTAATAARRTIGNGCRRRRRRMLDEVLSCSAIGSPATVRQALEAFIVRTRPQELMITSQIFDHAARLRSYELTAAVRKSMEQS